VQAQCEILEQATVAPGVREEYINLFHGLRKVESLLATTRPGALELGQLG
jgi:hypothetical protein